MDPTHLTSHKSQRTAPHSSRLAFAVIAAAALTCLAPTTRVDAGSGHRACATANAATYTVAAGDSWFRVATASGTTTAVLLGANGADASAVLYPGDVLCLPNGVHKQSTAAVYASFDQRRGERGFDERRGALLDALAAGDLEALPTNDLASSPLAHELRSLGAFRADASGAGPAVYGLFHRRADARAAARSLASRGRIWLTVPAWYR